MLDYKREFRKNNKQNHVIDIFRKYKILSKKLVKDYSKYAMSTVIDIFNALISRKIIIPKNIDEEIKPGRKSEFYKLNTYLYLYLGFTFTQSGMYFSLVSFTGEIIKTYYNELNFKIKKKEFVDIITDYLIKIIKENRKYIKNITSINCSIPGNIDETGKLIKYTLMPQLDNLNFKVIFKSVFKNKKIYFNNNISGFLGYFLFNDDVIKNYDKILLISLRSGVANGIIFKGQILSSNGEIGHVKVGNENRKCICGRIDCLDLYLSHKIISDEILTYLKISKIKQLSIDEIIKHYKSNNDKIKEIIDEKFLKLSSAILDSINIISPNLIILSGELFNCYDEPKEKIKYFISKIFEDSRYVKNYFNTKIIYKDLDTISSSVGLCYSRIKDEFNYYIE